MAATKSFDVIIVGAGSVGTPTALAWPKPASRSSSSINARASARARTSGPSAACGPRIPTRPRSASACGASRSSPTWKERHGDDIEWHKGGYSYVAYRPEEEKTLKELLTVQKSYGLNIDWLDAGALLGIIPDLDPDGLIGGTFSPDDGNASPLLAVHAFYSRAKKLGAEFRFDETRHGPGHRPAAGSRACAPTRASTRRRS